MVVGAGLRAQGFDSLPYIHSMATASAALVRGYPNDPRNCTRTWSVYRQFLPLAGAYCRGLNNYQCTAPIFLKRAIVPYIQTHTHTHTHVHTRIERERERVSSSSTIYIYSCLSILLLEKRIHIYIYIERERDLHMCSLPPTTESH